MNAFSAWWAQLALVMAGGALGAGLRFALGGWALNRFGDGLPWGTLAANLLGCLLAGLAIAWLEQRGAAALWWRAFLIVGLIGGLTTFSALAIELLLMLRGSRAMDLALYLGISLAGGLALLAAGLRVGRWLHG